MILLPLAVLICFVSRTHALIPFIDGGKDMPKLYNGYFDSQISKQASTAVSKALQAGNRRIEVNFPPVPNVEEVRFGTPLNKKFGQLVARDLGVPGGYRPGSDVSRQQIAFANAYWAKQVGGSVAGRVAMVTAEPLNISQVKKTGSLQSVRLLMGRQQSEKQQLDACIAINPGGEETWERVRTTLVKNDRSPFVVLNSAYSTTYGLGNKAGYEEAYYLKRISKGYIFRAFPGPWYAYLEKPDATVELLQTFEEKPQLNEVAKLVREESFKRFAIGNDRWTTGFGGRL